MLFIKNFFFVFIICLFLLFSTKFLFLFYIFDDYSNISQSIYAIFWGYKFDFAVSGIIALIATFFDFNKKSMALLSSFLLVSVFLSQISDIIYFNEAGRHIGYEVKDAFVDAKSLFLTAYSKDTILTTFSLVLSIIIFILVFKFLNKNATSIKLNKFYILKKLTLILFAIFFIRGMFNNIPLNPWQSNQIGNNKQSILALNGTYNAIYSITKKKSNLKSKNISNLSKKEKILILKKMYEQPEEYNIKTNKSNIVFLFLESWSAINMKPYGYHLNTTPFYNELLKKSIRPKAMIAGGHRTTEGIFSSLTSFQNPLGKTIAKTQLQSYKYTSIIDILKENSYKSMFFQGTAKETSGTGALTQSLGFEYSYGKDDIKKRIYDENSWGVHDTDLYNFAINKLENSKEPFVIGINGASTHDNQIPEGITEIFFTKDKAKNKELNALHYSDLALKEFVNKIETIYPNTIFVLLADHCGGGIKESSFLNYLIPFAIYSKNLEAKYYDEYISHRDIAPTVMDLVLGDYQKIAPSFSGKSLIRDKNFYSDYYHNGTLGLIYNNKSIEINTSTNNHKCFDLENFQDKEIECTQEILDLKNKALSFTDISQELLFKGKTKQYKEYR